MLNFDSKLGFFDQPIIRRILKWAVWWFLCSSLFVSGASVFAVIVDDYKMCVFDVDCINFYFFDVMKVPFSGLAVFAAILALLNANHRSQQSADSLTAAIDQNRHANYFSHIEYFKDHMDVSPKGLFVEGEVNIVYRRFFPQSFQGNVRINDDLFNDLESRYVTPAISLLADMEAAYKEKWLGGVHNALDGLVGISKAVADDMEEFGIATRKNVECNHLVNFFKDYNERQALFDGFVNMRNCIDSYAYLALADPDFDVKAFRKKVFPLKLLIDKYRLS